MDYEFFYRFVKRLYFVANKLFTELVDICASDNSLDWLAFEFVFL